MTAAVTKKRQALKDAKKENKQTLRVVFARGQITDVRFPIDSNEQYVGRSQCELTIDDPSVSRRHAVVRRDASHQLSIRDLGSSNGLVVNGQPTPDSLLADNDVVRVGDSLFVVEAGEPLTHPQGESTALVGSAPSLASAIEELDRFSPTDLSLLILGETGTGKELAALRVHQQSAVKGAFLPANCGAIPKELVESYFFGHTKGAFTGATHAQVGAFIEANGGTLFLDEIGEMPLDVQPKLLRVLESKTVYPVGSFAATPTTARVIAATNVNLHEAVTNGRFRADLLMRLAGYTITLPALRQRRGDILMLVDHFVAAEGAKVDTRLDADAATALLLHAWPGNVRELRQMAKKFVVDIKHLDRIEVSFAAALAQAPLTSQTTRVLDKAALNELLVRFGGNVARVARALGKQRMQVYRLLRDLDLDPTRYRDDGASARDKPKGEQ